MTLQTALGGIEIEVYSDRAPLSASQFLHCVQTGHYVGGTFWRTVRADNDRGSPPIEVVQAAAAEGSATLEPLAHEPTSISGLRHQDGTASLARAEPGSATAAAFFICLGDQPALDEGGLRNADGLGFAAFGRVVRGMDVVRAIHQGAALAEAPAEYVRGQVLVAPVRIEQAALGGGT
ncbi:MAG: peptidylprolyl isomerase [Rubrivivax sp.]|nr:peptidylprolyl isomerase [Rubrivivax sp.]